MKTLPGLRAIAAEFDDYIVDVWGVIHDGERPYEGVLDALQQLASLPGKRVLFVTNTSRRGEAVVRTLVDVMGIHRRHFFDVVSSGDVTRSALLARDAAVFAGLPGRPRCLHHGDPSFVPWLLEDDMPFELTADVAAADLVVATGAARDHAEVAATVMRLSAAASRDVPLVCTNPDRVIPRTRGEPGIGPGEIAFRYAELGGRVLLYGKPHRPIYDEARQRLGGTWRRVLAIGDRIDTDIRGARTAGLPSVLVTHGGPASATAGGDPARPDFVLDELAW